MPPLRLRRYGAAMFDTPLPPFRGISFATPLPLRRADAAPLMLMLLMRDAADTPMLPCRRARCLLSLTPCYAARSAPRYCHAASRCLPFSLMFLRQLPIFFHYYADCRAVTFID